MKVNYDAATDTLTVILRDTPVAESDEDKPGVILDYAADGAAVDARAALPDRSATARACAGASRPSKPMSRPEVGLDRVGARAAPPPRP